MMRHEFIQVARIEVGFGRNWDRLDGDLWEAVTNLYTSPELDSVCTGTDRHRKFARWLNENQERLVAEYWMVSVKNQSERIERKITVRVHEIRELRRQKEEVEAVYGLMRFFSWVCR